MLACHLSKSSTACTNTMSGRAFCCGGIGVASGCFRRSDGELANKSDHLQRNFLRKHDDRIILDRICGEPARKPGRKFAKKERIRHGRIDDACARVESGLNAVAMNDGLAKAVDRRGGQFVKPRRCCGECCPLLRESDRLEARA